MNGPVSELLSVPIWLLTTLHVVTLTLHFLAIGVVFGSVVLLLLGRRATAGGIDDGVRGLLHWLPAAMAAAVTLGVAPLLFLQLVAHRPVYAAAIVSGWLWLAVPAAASVAYFALYGIAMGQGRDGLRAPALLVVAAIGLVAVSIVYASVFDLTERPPVIASVYAAAQDGLVLNPRGGEWGFRWLHMVTGFLVTGAFVLGLLDRRADGLPSERGGNAYAVTLVVAIIAGLAYLFRLGSTLGPWMRTSAPIWLLGAIALSFASMYFFFKGRMLAAGLALGVSVLGMVANRHLLRAVRLEGVVAPADMTFRPQWGIFAVFLVSFVAALATVGWMIAAYRREARAEGA